MVVSELLDTNMTLVRPDRAENIDPCTNHAVKYATARGRLTKPKQNKLSRQGTNFWATTRSRGRPPPHQAVSGPKKLLFVLFLLA